MFEQLENEDDEAMFKELKLVSKTEEDREELIKILKFLLCYPSNKLAQIHSQANRLGKLDDRKTRQQLRKDYISNSQHYSACQCCYYLVQKQRLKLSSSMGKIVTLGEATKLFFNDIKFAMLMMVISIVVYAIYSMATNILASDHNLNSCFKQKTCKLALIGLGSKLFATYSWENTQFYIGQVYLGLLMSILWGIMFIFKTIQQRKISMHQDKQAATASDFTVMFTNLPKHYNKQTLQQKLNEYADNVRQMISYPQEHSIQSEQRYDGKFTISNFNPLEAYYQTLKLSESEMMTLAQDRLNCALDKLRNIILQRSEKDSFTLPKEQRQILYREIDELRVEITSQRIQKLRIIQQKYRRLDINNNRIVFVTFNHTYAKINLLKLYENSIIKKLKSCFKKKQNKNLLNIEGVKIRRAPEPEDVIWQNIGASKRQLFLRKMLTYFITFILLGASFAAIYGISRAQQSSENITISFLLSLVINIINILLNTFIQMLSTHQKDYTTTNYQISIAFKITAAQLINSIVISIIAAYYIKGNIYQTGGLVDDVFYFALLNAIIPPLLRVVNGYFWFLRFVRYWYSTAKKKLHCESQIQFNKRWEDAEFQIGLEYVYILKTVIYTAFFVSLQPIIAIFGFVGLILMFYAEKISLYYQSIRPKPSSDIITLSMNSILYLSIIAYALGSLTWTNFLPHEHLKHTFLPNMFCMCIGIILYFVTYGELADILVTSSYANLSYQKQRLFLPSEYDRLNPTTKTEGLKKFIKYLEQKRDEHKNSAFSTASSSLNQQNDDIQLLFFQQLMIENKKYRTDLEQQSQQNDIVCGVLKSQQSPEKIYDQPNTVKRHNSYLKKQSVEVRAVIDRLQSIEPMQSASRLKKTEDDELKVDTHHLKNILTINTLPRQQRPSMLSSKFNPLDFLEAVHGESN